MKRVNPLKELMKVGVTLGLMLPLTLPAHGFAEAAPFYQSPRSASTQAIDDTDAIASMTGASSLLPGSSRGGSNVSDIESNINGIGNDLVNQMDRSQREQDLVNKNQQTQHDINQGNILLLQADEVERSQKRAVIQGNERGYAAAKSVPKRLPEPPAQDYDDSSLSDVCAPTPAPGKPNLQMILSAYKSFQPSFKKLAEDGAEHFNKLIEKGNANYDRGLELSYADYMKKLGKKPEKPAEVGSTDPGDPSAPIRIAGLELTLKQSEADRDRQDLELIERFVNPKKGLAKVTHDAKVKKQDLIDKASDFVQDSRDQTDLLKQMFVSYVGSLKKRQKAIVARMEEAKAASASWIAMRDVNPMTGQVERSVLDKKMKQYKDRIAELQFKDITPEINAAFAKLSSQLTEMDDAAGRGSASEIYGSSKKFMFALSKTMNELGQKLNGEGGPIDSCETAAAEHVGIEKEMNLFKEQAKAKAGGSAGGALASQQMPKGARAH
jgi:hypothetical protein